MKKLIRVCAIVATQLSLMISLTVATPLPARALFESAISDACSGSQVQETAACTNGSSKLDGIVRTALNLLSVVAGIAAVIMIIIAGIRYATSGGDSSGISGAKNTIIYAIVGLAIVALAQLIVKFVLAEIT